MNEVTKGLIEQRKTDALYRLKQNLQSIVDEATDCLVKVERRGSDDPRRVAYIMNYVMEATREAEKLYLALAVEETEKRDAQVTK